MTANRTTPPAPTLEDEVNAALSVCQGVLSGPLAGLSAVLPRPPRSAAGWFDFLKGFPQREAKVQRMRRMARAIAAMPASPWPKGSVERFALLQAFVAALPRLDSLPVDISIKRLYCAASLQVASADKRYEALLDVETQAFGEMAKIATLRRFPAGQLSFDRTTLPRSWLLKVHPLALPGLLVELAVGWRGFGPVMTPHVYHWRPNPLFVLKGENERSLWRMAKTLEQQPDVKGLAAASWLYCAEVGQAFPHLAWMRDFFAEHGAYLVDLEPADPDSGFMIGSAKRRRMYEERKFHPRQTLLLWRRQDILAWAAAHPDLACDAAAPAAALPRVPAGGHDCAPKPPHPARGHVADGWLSSGRFTWINAVPFLNRHPKMYILTALAAPSTIAALSTALIFEKWLAFPAFLVAFVIAWVLQYFLLQ